MSILFLSMLFLCLNVCFDVTVHRGGNLLVFVIPDLIRDPGTVPHRWIPDQVRNDEITTPVNGYISALKSCTQYTLICNLDVRFSVTLFLDLRNCEPTW